MKTNRSNIIVASLALASSLITPDALGQPLVWVAHGPSAYWTAVASSADGTKLVATCTNGLYTSTDSGATWTARDTSRYWAAVASSADGVKLVAGSLDEYGGYSDGYIYTSTDSGANWVRQSTVGDWVQIASSSDGNRLVAIDAQADFSNQLLTSVNAGVNWYVDVAWPAAPDFMSVAAAADALYMAAAIYGGHIYIRTDTTHSWYSHGPAQSWQGVACSADGAKFVGVPYGGQIYTSGDYGSTWTARDSSRNWNCVASSSTGTRLIAAVNGGQIYTSSDTGATWTPSENNRAWRSVASSSDGSKLVAAVYGGQIYTCAVPLPPQNDLWSGALPLANGATSSMSTTTATSTGDPVPTCGYNVSNTVWFTFTPATSRVVAVNTCGSDFDTVVQAFVNNSGTMTPIGGGCNDDSNVCPGTRQSCLAFAATAGITYYFMVGGYNGASGNLSITASEVPVAITQQPGGGTANAGDSFAFSVYATGAGLSYQWQLGGSRLSGATDSTLTLTNLYPGNAGDYQVIVTNVYGAVTSAVATLAVQPALDLALDTTGLTWTTGGGSGGYGWFRQTDVSHDGVDSAECGAPLIGFPSSSAWMQTTVTGPETLTFYWRFYVPIRYPRITDYLGFYMDGVYQAGVGSPFVVWSYQTIYVGAGSHTLKWSYVLSGSYHGGGPGFVDQVALTAGATASLISNQPDPQTTVAGTDAIFSVQAGGTPPLRYQWRFYGTNLAGATDSSLTLTNVMPVQAGNYSVVVTNDYGPSVTSSVVALTVTTIPLAEALDYANPGWTTYGNGLWFGQVGQTHDGVDAARSGAITNYQQSVLSLNLLGPGTLSFWWKVSSETNYDYFKFWTNNTLQKAICGEVDWQQQTVSLPAGMNTVVWQYIKDVSISLGQDAAWLDQVSYDGPPYLAINPLTDQQVMLFWPTSATGFGLQCSTNLAHPAPWQWTTNVPVVVEDNWVVTNNTASHLFYRLKK